MTKSNSTPTSSPSRLELLQTAVSAKAAYWDALRALELDCTGEEQSFTDAHNNQVIELIEGLAAGIDTPAAAFTMVDEDSLSALNNLLGQD